MGHRRAKLRCWAAALALCLTVAHPPTASAEDPSPSAGEELLRRAFANLYADDYVQMLRLATHSRAGRTMTRKIQILRKQSELPGKALVRFLEPHAVRRTSILILENHDGYDDHYVYLPAARRIMHLSAAQRADSFFGTDFAYEDMEPKRVDDYTVERVDSRVVAEIPCEVLEIRPRPDFDTSYDRMTSCIDPERGLILWTEFDRKGSFLKRLEIDPTSIQKIGSRYIPFRVSMTTPKRGSRTEVITESYELRSAIPDSLFTAVNLEAGDARQDRARSSPAETTP